MYLVSSGAGMGRMTWSPLVDAKNLPFFRVELNFRRGRVGVLGRQVSLLALAAVHRQFYHMAVFPVKRLVPVLT